MKLAPLIQQFWTFLPQFSDLFSESKVINSLTATGGIATAALLLPHAFTTGQQVNITGVIQIVEVTLASYDADTGIFTIETDGLNGLASTFDFNARTAALTQPVKVTLQGFNESVFNGTFPLIAVLNRQKFTCQLPKELTETPTGNGQQLVYSFNNFIGFHEITVVSPLIFTYPITSTVDLNTTGAIKVHDRFRINGAINLERALEEYTKLPEDKYTAFLTYGAEVVSKDRYILNDSNTTLRGGTRLRQRMLDSFNVVVIAPTTAQLSALAARDSMEEVEIALFRTALFLPTEDRFTAETNYFYNFDSAIDVAYNRAYLARQWTFQAQYDLTQLDGFTGSKRVPMLDINGVINNDLDVIINLDEEPL